jgi:prepilin-type N-terminal cleavage/methylation domain-containing protein
MIRIITRPRGRRGVTLVELLAVLGIILLLSALGGPRMYRWAQVAGQRGAANQVVADLALTRVQAVRQGQTVSMRVEGSTRYRITVDDPTTGNEVRELKDVNLGALYKNTSVESPGTGRIAFDSRGMLRPGSATSVTITRGGVVRQVTVTTVGRIVRGDLQAN